MEHQATPALPSLADAHFAYLQQRIPADLLVAGLGKGMKEVAYAEAEDSASCLDTVEDVQQVTCLGPVVPTSRCAYHFYTYTRRTNLSFPHSLLSSSKLFPC